MKFLDLITTDRIIPDLEATTKDDVIKEMLETFDLSKANLKKNYDLVVERESRGTTGMGEGIAIPHTNMSNVKEIIGAFGRSVKGVDFASLDGQPVHLVFMILSAEGHKEVHIDSLKYISKSMRNEVYKRFMMEATGKRDLMKILKEIDQKD